VNQPENHPLGGTAVGNGAAEGSLGVVPHAATSGAIPSRGAWRDSELGVPLLPGLAVLLLLLLLRFRGAVSSAGRSRGRPGSTSNGTPSCNWRWESRRPQPESPASALDGGTVLPSVDRRDGKATPSTSTSTMYLDKTDCKVRLNKDMAAECKKVVMLMLCGATFHVL
jgi:hypothetical protein